MTEIWQGVVIATGFFSIGFLSSLFVFRGFAAVANLIRNMKTPKKGDELDAD